MNLIGALQIALPEAFLAVSALLLLVLGAYRPKGVAAVSLGAGFALAVAAVLAAVGPGGAAFAGSYIADAASAYALSLIHISHQLFLQA